MYKKGETKTSFDDHLIQVMSNELLSFLTEYDLVATNEDMIPVNLLAMNPDEEQNERVSFHESFYEPTIKEKHGYILTLQEERELFHLCRIELAKRNHFLVYITGQGWYVSGDEIAYFNTDAQLLHNDLSRLFERIKRVARGWVQIKPKTDKARRMRSVLRAIVILIDELIQRVPSSDDMGKKYIFQRNFDLIIIAKDEDETDDV